MKRFAIEEKNLEFKNIISGPAPVGRILNYIIYCKEVGLLHKNGHRYTNLEDNIGYAWTTELMIGLEIFSLGVEKGNAYQLLLTNKGMKLYETIKGINIDFVEDWRYSNIDVIRDQLLNYSSESLMVFEDIFRSSYPFKILREYLNTKGFYHNRKEFIDDYFETIKNIYDRSATVYNPNARTTTGDNRVPSLIQLCYLFNYISEEDNIIKFNAREVNKSNNILENKVFTYDEMSKEVKKEEEQIKVLENIVDRYGLDGNIHVTALVRNSSLQQMFKQNLLVEFEGKCAVCNLENRELLIGSHIKPSSECNALQKADSNNGLLLCANHDKLFDRHLITFDPFDGNIMISKKIIETDLKLLLLDSEFKLPEKYLTEERFNYLMEHNLSYEKKEVEE